MALVVVVVHQLRAVLVVLDQMGNLILAAAAATLEFLLRVQMPVVAVVIKHLEAGARVQVQVLAVIMLLAMEAVEAADFPELPVTKGLSS